MTRTPLIAAREFIQATRDAGYRGPAQAVAELVDNALQAGASSIDIRVRGEAGDIELHTLDDGAGMDAEALSRALQFGGSSRFNDRSGLGRFGMGLPNSSMSQARRVEVYTWRSRSEILVASLDLDEIAAGRASGPTTPERCSLPAGAPPAYPSGTLVVWRRCDRLEGRRPSKLRSDLLSELGKTFRRYIWRGVTIGVDGTPCPAADPLLLDARSPRTGASQFGEPLRLALRAPEGGPTGIVTARFAELPVHAWHGLSNGEKRALGVTKGGGIYVMRADRQIDQGWLFMGEKRRENYDDWWRAEIEFGPELDDAFGITNTKQQVRPSPWLAQELTATLEPVARALTARVRRAHQTLKARERFAASERLASTIEGRLPRLRYPTCPERSPLVERLDVLYPDLFREPTKPDLRLVEDDLGHDGVYRVLLAPKRVVVVLNTSHPFYRHAYAPLADSEEPGAVERRSHIEVLLLALARAEAAEGVAGRASHEAWSQILGEMVRR